MIPLLLKIGLLVLTLLIGSFMMGFLFKKKPRQANKKIAWTYEILIILFGLAFCAWAFYRSQTTQYVIPYVLMTAGGVYISVTHIISQKMGRYT